MKDWSVKKAAKKLLKRAKKHPDWYTKEDIRYAKRVRKEIKAAQKVTDAGYKVRRIVSIVDRQEGGSEAIKEAGFESISIFKLEDII